MHYMGTVVDDVFVREEVAVSAVVDIVVEVEVVDAHRRIVSIVLLGIDV